MCSDQLTTLWRRSFAVVLLLGACAAQSATVLITGANTGIGLEFARQYAAAGWTVIATHRREQTPEPLAALAREPGGRVTVERMDVRDLAMIDAVAAKLRGVPIDVLINNAGVVADLSNPKPQMFGQLDYPLFDTFMHTNVRGPLKVSEAFLSNVKASQQKRIVVISSLSGSIAGGSTARPGRVGSTTVSARRP